MGRLSFSTAWAELVSGAASAFSRLPWLLHGFSTCPGGVSELVDRSAVASEKSEHVLNLSFRDWDTRDSVVENRRRFLSALGAFDLTLVSLSQFHSDTVRVFQTPYRRRPWHFP